MRELIHPKDCPLCKHERLTYWYHSDALCWIADCLTFGVPMVVFRPHREPFVEVVPMIIQKVMQFCTWLKEGVQPPGAGRR